MRTQRFLGIVSFLLAITGHDHASNKEIQDWIYRHDQLPFSSATEENLTRHLLDGVDHELVEELCEYWGTYLRNLQQLYDAGRLLQASQVKQHHHSGERAQDQQTFSDLMSSLPKKIEHIQDCINQFREMDEIQKKVEQELTDPHASFKDTVNTLLQQPLFRNAPTEFQNAIISALEKVANAEQKS